MSVKGDLTDVVHFALFLNKCLDESVIHNNGGRSDED